MVSGSGCDDILSDDLMCSAESGAASATKYIRFIRAVSVIILLNWER